MVTAVYIMMGLSIVAVAVCEIASGAAWNELRATWNDWWSAHQ